ncbi:hypothetical protein BGX28_005224 [Mortierella sp. GBA30]|nr:hypothetical protein BGX28_005224 [Mortierella sp. GBA30]
MLNSSSHHLSEEWIHRAEVSSMYEWSQHVHAKEALHTRGLRGSHSHASNVAQQAVAVWLHCCEDLTPGQVHSAQQRLFPAALKDEIPLAANPGAFAEAEAHPRSQQPQHEKTEMLQAQDGCQVSLVQHRSSPQVETTAALDADQTGGDEKTEEPDLAGAEGLLVVAGADDVQNERGAAERLAANVQALQRHC